MDQQGAKLGSSQGRANTAEPYLRSLRGRFQSGYGNASYAVHHVHPEGPRTIQHFLGMTHEEMYKSFFGPQIECPDTTEDVGLSCNRPAAQVSNLMAEHTVLLFIMTSFWRIAL